MDHITIILVSYSESAPETWWWILKRTSDVQNYASNIHWMYGVKMTIMQLQFQLGRIFNYQNHVISSVSYLHGVGC